MDKVPDQIAHAQASSALKDFEVPKDMRLDMTRGFDTVHPPMQIMIWRGKGMPTAWAEEPNLAPRWHQFVADIAAHEQQLEPGEREQATFKTICFEQDGFSFDADRLVIPEMMDTAQRARAQKQLAKEKAAQRAHQALVQSMRDDGFDVDEASIPRINLQAATAVLSATDVVRDPRAGGHDDYPRDEKAAAIDLRAWARGEVSAHFFAVRRAFKDQHAVHIRDADHAKEWLLENAGR